MANLTAADLHAVLDHATKGDNRKTIEQHTGLAWMLDELDTHRDRLGSLLGGKSAEQTLGALRAAVDQGDDAHDDAHRFLHGLLIANLHRGSAERRATIARGLQILYPDGLQVVRQSYRREFTATAAFAARLERREVAAALDALGEHVKRVDDLARDCVRAGEQLGKALLELEKAEIEGLASPLENELFEARNAALRAWTTFVGNVEHLLAGADPDTVRRREGLLLLWRRLKTESATLAPAATPATEPVEPPAAEPEPV